VQRNWEEAQRPTDLIGMLGASILPLHVLGVTHSECFLANPTASLRLEERECLVRANSNVYTLSILSNVRLRRVRGS
jgi:hypothetical protein